MKHRLLFKFLVISLAFTLLTSSIVSGQIDFPAGSRFRLLKGMDAAGLSSAWMNPGFDDSSWTLWYAPIRYGDGVGGTSMNDMQNNYSTVYLRTTFDARNIELLSTLQLDIDYDDGFVIWVNGQRVLSRFAPAILSHDGFATENHESGEFEPFALNTTEFQLLEGDNILAIQAFNVSLESSDFMINLGMQAEVVLPSLEDSIGLRFNMPSGFYEDPFFLEITAADPSWKVVYTIDGSNPKNSETAIVAGNTANILVDPAGTGRAQTPGFVVRASSSTDGILPSNPESRSYIFLDEVFRQAHPGGEWPTGSVNRQVIDLEMDQKIVDHPDYKNEMVNAMKDVPTISVITGTDNLFDPATGIYVNAWGHGFEWERECSVEMFSADASDGFEVNAGLRIRGGWSRHPEFPKHSFRLFFRSEYGDSKLYYPLFGDDGVDRYDKIDLRTSQNYAWAQGDSRNTFLRDVVSRDMQRDMGQPYSRSRYYHLYIDGMYWGLFQTQERSEARFAADYLGGNTDDYDVIKVDTEDWQYRIEATDGDFNSWFAIWEMCQEGFADNASYFALQGLDEQGKPKIGGQVYVEIDNLIDYILSIFYTGNFDAPTSTFGSNKGPNNFFAISNREDPSSGFTFYNHDAEHSMFTEPASPGTGLYENRVSLAERTDGKNMYVSDFSAFHPQWLHHKLTENAEYRSRFKDRASLHLEGEGALTPAKNLERLNIRYSEIENAIIGESARWGSSRGITNPYTKNDHWIPQVNKIRDIFCPYRTNILKDQLEEAGLYPDLDAPEYTLDDEVLYDQAVSVTGAGTLIIKNLNGFGDICYTTDGSDPCTVGGNLAVNALSTGSDQVEIQFGGSAVVKARIKRSRRWSSVKEIRLVAEQQDYADLAITELHYHPLELVIMDDTTSSKDLEFLEFKNTGQDAINLGELILDSAVYYEFPEDALLPPGQFYVVASKPSAFYKRYGLIASGNFKKNLSNGGEEVLLRDRDGNPVIHFIYSDDPPWPVEADGEGFSLVPTLNNPVGNPAIFHYWNNSASKGGSPFEDDSVPQHANQPVNEDAGIRIFPNPTSGLLNITIPDSEFREKSIFSLYGISGNLIHKAELDGDGTIQLEGLNLSSGLYLVRIHTGNRIYTEKIIYR